MARVEGQIARTCRRPSGGLVPYTVPFVQEWTLGRCHKLLQKACASPSGLTFADAKALAECFGFVHVRTRGSHHLFKRPGHPGLLNLQSRQGRAPSYQVRQLLATIDALQQEDPDDGRP